MFGELTRAESRALDSILFRALQKCSAQGSSHDPLWDETADTLDELRKQDPGRY